MKLGGGKSDIFVFMGLALLFLVLGILRLNDLSLYTDSTRYLIWGNSIAHGEGFVDGTQPIPESYIVNAPFFSVLLAPVLVVFPLSLVAAKVWTLLWGLLALVLFYRWLRSRFKHVSAFLATLFLALNPMMLVLATEVLSEAPFLCTLFGIILLLERMKNKDQSESASGSLVLILALTMLLREIGVSLVAAAILYLFFKKKRILAGVIFFCSAALFIAWTYRNLGMASAPDPSQSPNITFIFQHFVTSPQTSFFGELFHRIQLNMKGYILELAGMLFYPFMFNLIVNPSSLFGTIGAILNFAKYFAGLLFLPLLLLGIIRDFKRSAISPFLLLFLALYLSIVLSYPVRDVRFLFPFLPFMIYYTMIAFRTIAERIALRRSFRRACLPAILALAFLPNVVCIFEIIRTNLHYVRDPAGFAVERPELALQSGFFATPWKAMGVWIEKETPEGSIIASPRKEIVAFSPDHKFLELNRAVPLPVFESSLRNDAVEYLLAPAVIDSIDDYQTLIDESTRFHFEKLKHIGRLSLYDVQPSLEHRAYAQKPVQFTLNLNNTRDLLRLGRLALRNEQYSEALSIFSKLHAGFPYLTDLVYQLLLVHTFTLDSARAVRSLQELYTSPTATSYIAPSRIHIYAMNVLLNAKSLNDPALKAEKFYRVARLYWDMGYPQQAYTMVRQSVQTDSSFFVGLLWAWHYSVQLNDTARARFYLRQLERIDSRNRIVRSYRVMTSLFAEIQRERDHRKRSALRIALAREYDSIDLPREALDNAQRAIAEDTLSRDAWKTLADLFQERGHAIAAERARKRLCELE
jgi:4-amino-4-deoxy-L-arabinose transferase-like glycosyltransferase